MDDRPEALTRYRGLQLASIALAVGGLLLAATAIYLNRGVLAGGSPPDNGRAVAALIAFTVGATSFVVGLVMNAVRAVVVRAALPWWRYRGPSVIVMLLLATILTTIASLAILDEAAALQDGGDLSVSGSFVFLTITQLGMLAVASVFVALPRALVGARLLPPSGLPRSVLIGLALAVPAWLVAQAVTVVVVLLLDALFGISPTPGVADAAIARIDVGVVVVTLVVVAPIAEELFFRGVAYNAWKREYGSWTATLASAALFALIHQSIFLALPIFVLGVVLARTYERTGSLPAAMALHAGFNAISVAIGLLDRFNVI